MLRTPLLPAGRGPILAEKAEDRAGLGQRTFWIYWVGIVLIALGAVRGALAAGS
jgi:hypothetical protein